MSGHRKVQGIVEFTALFTLLSAAYAQESKFENRVAGATGKAESADHGHYVNPRIDGVPCCADNNNSGAPSAR